MPQKIFRKTRTILPHLSNLGKDILIPINLPKTFEVRGVVAGGLELASFHDTIVYRVRKMATPPGFLTLVPSTLITMLCKKSICPRTITTELLTTQVSCTQETITHLVITMSINGSNNESKFLSLPDNLFIFLF